ncbi:hypothetical protein D3C86_1527680 [compost metagenome]
MREEIVALEHDADIGAQLAQRLGIFSDSVTCNFNTTGIDLLQPVHAAQQRALARAGAADEGEDFTTADRQRHAFQDFQSAKALVNVFNDYFRHEASFPANATAGTTGSRR